MTAPRRGRSTQNMVHVILTTSRSQIPMYATNLTEPPAVGITAFSPPPYHQLNPTRAAGGGGEKHGDSVSPSFQVNLWRDVQKTRLILTLQTATDVKQYCHQCCICLPLHC
uniref:Uncharacterized protein n=1 Tax=Eutreptiella gymnastica TaxID=73025 RepID=A0A7S4D198_9EUGL